MILEAGRRMNSLWQEMAAKGNNPVSLLLDGVAKPSPHRHYPSGDVYDFASHAQFYYHVHRHGEFGHIHLFQRASGMPAGVRPLIPGGEANAPCHLIAVGFGASGDAVELFTTNRWVTGESWYDARSVKAMLPCFRLATKGKAEPVAAWLEALVGFYSPAIGKLVDERDAAIVAWARTYPGVDPLNDSRLEIPSRLLIDPSMDVGGLS